MHCFPLDPPGSGAEVLNAPPRFGRFRDRQPPLEALVLPLLLLLMLMLMLFLLPALLLLAAPPTAAEPPWSLTRSPLPPNAPLPPPPPGAVRGRSGNEGASECAWALATVAML